MLFTPEMAGSIPAPVHSNRSSKGRTLSVSLHKLVAAAI